MFESLRKIYNFFTFKYLESIYLLSDTIKKVDNNFNDIANQLKNEYSLDIFGDIYNTRKCLNGLYSSRKIAVLYESSFDNITASINDCNALNKEMLNCILSDNQKSTEMLLQPNFELIIIKRRSSSNAGQFTDIMVIRTTKRSDGKIDYDGYICKFADNLKKI